MLARGNSCRQTTTALPIHYEYPSRECTSLANAIRSGKEEQYDVEHAPVAGSVVSGYEPGDQEFEPRRAKRADRRRGRGSEAAGQSLRARHFYQKAQSLSGG